MVTGFSVRQLQASEFERWRDLRLRALQDSPHAFGSRYEDEARRPPSFWRERAAAAAAGGDRVMFVAEASDGHLAACAGAYVDTDGDPIVISMWVEPQGRSRGLARALLGAIADWARARGDRSLRLWVVDGNTPAATLYLAYGFRPTGAAARNERGAIEQEMALGLAGQT
jgi:GNAT superfamily N-acetyltransferase